MTGAQVDQLQTILIAAAIIVSCFFVYRKFIEKRK